MIFVPKKNIYFPKYQRGNFAMFPAGTISEQIGPPGISPNSIQIFDHANFPLDSTAGISILPSGAINGHDSGGSLGEKGRWDGGSGTLVKTDYQFRYDITAGQTPNGFSNVVNVWLAAVLTFNQWEQVETGLGARSSTGNLRMRLAVAPFTEYSSSTLFLEADTT